MRSFLKTIYIDSEKIKEEYIQDISLFQGSPSIDLRENITYFVGENGSGKSTFLEAVASEFGFNAEGGTKHARFQTSETDRQMSNWIRLSWSPSKFLNGYFFRGESVYNTINYLEEIDGFAAYGGENLHKNSHGEQFLKILESRIHVPGFYIFDEIESALSPANQLKVVEIIKYMSENGSQFLISTHSPIILSIHHNSQILSFDFAKIQETDYNLVPCVDMYRRILCKKVRENFG